MPKKDKVCTCDNCLNIELENCFEEIECLKYELLEAKDLAISTLLKLVNYLEQSK